MAAVESAGLRPEMLEALEALREGALKDLADDEANTVASVMLDLPEELMWDTVAVIFSAWTMKMCGQEDWYRHALRSVMLGLLVRIDANAANALLNANIRICSDDDEDGDDV